MRLVDSSEQEEEESGPAAGKELSVSDVEMLAEAIQERQRKFRDEPYIMSFALVMMNIGDRYAQVTCQGGEWQGLKKDIPKGDGLPTCPDGHPLMQGLGLKIGWLQEVDPEAEAEEAAEVPEK